MELQINQKKVSVNVDPQTPLLWVLRDELRMTGTKFGCGMSLCGTCTIWIDGDPVRCCVYPVAYAEGKQITTIEGLSSDQSHPIQKAWVEHDVPQCGYCQSGMIMTAAALLKRNPDPSDEEIDSGMGNICRCGTYNRIRAAIHSAAKSMKKGGEK